MQENIRSQHIGSPKPHTEGGIFDIQKILENKINIFNPTYKEIAAAADEKGYLNGELPSAVRQLIENFITTIPTSGVGESAEKIILRKNLSRKKRKALKAKNHGNISRINPPVYTFALEKLQDQVFNAINFSQSDINQNEHFQVDEQLAPKFKIKSHISLLSELPIPNTVFEGVHPESLHDYANAYMQNKEHVHTQYNFVGDIIRDKSIPLVISTLKAYRDNELLSTERIKLTIVIANTVKEVYHHGCFVNSIPVQPGYIAGVFKNELRKRNLEQEFLEFLHEQELQQFLNGIFAEAYGTEAIRYITQAAKNDNIKLYGISLDDKTKNNLNMYAKSDEQYYISLPNGMQFVQSVDFKSFAGGEPRMKQLSVLDNTMGDGMREKYYNFDEHKERIKKHIPDQLHSLPIYPIEYKVGIPANFKGKLYTKKVFEQEFEQLYALYKNYLENHIINPLSPTE